MKTKLVFMLTILFVFSFIFTACGPSSEQQATLVAVSIYSTLTAEVTLKITTTPLPPTNTPTKSPTPTPTPVNTPTQTFTPTPNQTATVLNQIYATGTSEVKLKPKLVEPFSNNVFGWCDFKLNIEDDGARDGFYFDKGFYHVTYTSGNKYPQIFCAPFGTYYNFYVSVLTKLIGGDPGTSYGIIFRAYLQSFKGMTRLLINPNNEYHIDTRDSNGNWIVLQDWTKTNDMKPQGEWNKIIVSGIGPEFTFYINDKYQTRLIYKGADAGKGGIGVVVNSDTPKSSIEVLYDDMVIREP